MDESTPDAIALWRYQVIASLLCLDAAARGALHHAIMALSLRVFEHPKKGPITLGFGTIEEWYYAYKKENLEGLKLRRRSDHGKSRKIDDATAEKIEAIAAAHPALDGKGIQKELAVALKDSEQTPPSLSTLYRFLKATGLDRRNVPRHADHKAYAFDFAGDCWQGDVMYGPTIVTKDGKRKKTFLIAILDDATRLIAHAEFYFDDDLRSLRDCVKQALLKRGCPKRFYFDNGKIFRSRMMLAVAARLGIHLIHTKPYKPQGRAKLERFFGTVRRSFLKRIDLSKLDDLAAFNRLLFAFVEGEYHRSPHRGIEKETPLDRWMRLSDGIRPLPRDVDLDRLFLEETCRRVTKDGTFSLNSIAFEAGPRFIAQKLVVRFDPFDLRRAFLALPNDVLLEVFPVDLRQNRNAKRDPPRDQPKPPVNAPKLRALEDLADRQESQDPQNNQSGDPSS